MAEDVRRDQARLGRGDWSAFIDAMNAIRRRGAASPRYQDFVDVHARAMNMSPATMEWSVHSMGTTRGRNFLAWHRWFLRRFERRLQREEPDVTIPYWNWVTERTLPRPLRDRELLRRWGIVRDWPAEELPDRADWTWVRRAARFYRFQGRLESIHNEVHRAVGGNMVSARSPEDPLFWLHHAQIDRLWSLWQRDHPRVRPPNATEVLKPSPLFGVPVSDVLRPSQLGYRYA